MTVNQLFREMVSEETLNNLLIHAACCDNTVCERSPHCGNAQRLFYHSLVCKSPDCVTCTDLNDLIQKHASSCIDKNCKVINCLSFRQNKFTEQTNLIISVPSSPQGESDRDSSSCCTTSSTLSPLLPFHSLSINTKSPTLEWTPAAMLRKRSYDDLPRVPESSSYYDTLSPVSLDSYVTSRTTHTNGVINLPTRTTTSGGSDKLSYHNHHRAPQFLKGYTSRKDPAKLDIVARQKFKVKQTQKVWKQITAKMKITDYAAQGDENNKEEEDLTGPDSPVGHTNVQEDEEVAEAVTEEHMQDDDVVVELIEKQQSQYSPRVLSYITNMTHKEVPPTAANTPIHYPMQAWLQSRQMPSFVVPPPAAAAAAAASIPAAVEPPFLPTTRLHYVPYSMMHIPPPAEDLYQHNQLVILPLGLKRSTTATSSSAVTTQASIDNTMTCHTTLSETTITAATTAGGDISMMRDTFTRDSSQDTFHSSTGQTISTSMEEEVYHWDDDGLDFDFDISSWEREGEGLQQQHQQQQHPTSCADDERPELNKKKQPRKRKDGDKTSNNNNNNNKSNNNNTRKKKSTKQQQQAKRMQQQEQHEVVEAGDDHNEELCITEESCEMLLNELLSYSPLDTLFLLSENNMTPVLGLGGVEEVSDTAASIPVSFDITTTTTSSSENTSNESFSSSSSASTNKTTKGRKPKATKSTTTCNNNITTSKVRKTKKAATNVATSVRRVDEAPMDVTTSGVRERGNTFVDWEDAGISNEWLESLSRQLTQDILQAPCY